MGAVVLANQQRSTVARYLFAARYLHIRSVKTSRRMRTTRLNRAPLALARLVIVPATVSGLCPVRISWNPTGTPTSAGATVPYMRTNPWRPVECRWRATRTATRSATTRLLTVGEPTAATRNRLLTDSPSTKNENLPPGR